MVHKVLKARFIGRGCEFAENVPGQVLGDVPALAVNGVQHSEVPRGLPQLCVWSPSIGITLRTGSAPCLVKDRKRLIL